MANVRQFFRGKKIIAIGARTQPSIVGDVRFMARSGGNVTVADVGKRNDMEWLIKSLEPDPLEEWEGKVSFSFGNFDPVIFSSADLIIKPCEIALPHSISDLVREKGILMETPEIIFTKLAPPVLLVGIVGAAGKTTTAMMLREIMRVASAHIGKQVFFVTNTEGGAISVLERALPGDIVVMELHAGELKDFEKMRMSPYIAICPFMTEKDDCALFRNQSSNNFFIAPPDVAALIAKMRPKGRLVEAVRHLMPRQWTEGCTGDQQKDDLACAVEAARILKASDFDIEEGIKNFRPLEGRLQFIANFKDREFWNDGSSGCGGSTLGALKTVANNRNVVLVLGGQDNGEDMTEFSSRLGQYCSAVIALSGTGTVKLYKELLRCKDISHAHSDTLEDAFKKAIDFSRAGDVILFSPAFPQRGSHEDSQERVRQWNDLVVQAMRL